MPHAHDSRAQDLAVDAERDVLLAGRVPRHRAIAVDRSQRVEVGNAGLRILGGDRTAADIAAQLDDGVADLDAPFQPPVLLVRLAALDLEEHPEAASVDVVAAGLPGELGERLFRDERHLAAAAIDGGARFRLDEPQRAAHPLRERLRPRAVDEVTADRAAVEVDGDLLAERELPGGDRSVREPQRQVLSLGVVDRKSTRLTSSHVKISYAVYCLKKKKDAAQTRRSVIDRRWQYTACAL